MNDERSTLQARLLVAPFDADLRARYALLLEHAGEYDAAQEQYALLVQQQPGSAGPLLGLARCHLQRGDETGALEHYLRARQCDDHAPDEALDAVLARTRRTGTHLSAVPAADNVVTLERPAGRRVTFADVAGMDAVKKVLRLQIVEPFARPGLFAKFRKRAGGGVLLYGPPGCGKTLMARATAGECAAQFISVGISDVLNMWVGESERNLAALFEKARASAPSVLFFDELDALAYSRAKASSDHSRTTVNEFLNQLDGFGRDNEGVLVLAATNMPWDVDAAMKRPGRFSRQIFVPPPDQAARAAIFALRLADMPAEEIDTAALARAAEHFSGADIDGVVDDARDAVLEDIISEGRERNVTMADLLQAIARAQPSTLDWLRTARNLVKYAGADSSYRDVERYLRGVRLV